MKAFATAALAASLVACGGGGGDEASPPAPAQQTSLVGSFDVTGGGITPDPITSAQTPVFSATAEFSGSISPAGLRSFELPYALHRDGAPYRTGRLTCSWVSEVSALVRFVCTGGQPLPAQPVGTRTFNLYLQPALLHSFTGGTDEAQTTLTVTP